MGSWKIASRDQTERSDIGPTDCGRLSVFARRARSGLRVWHRRGRFSPSWLSQPLGVILWAISLAASILLPGLPLLASPALREWSSAHLLVVIPGIAIVIGLLLYWLWARRDASAREALRYIALHGRIAMPAGDLAPDDLLQNPRQVGSAPVFLPRRLRRFEDPNASESWVAEAIPSLLPREGRHGRRVALVGPAAMGKTRLVHELIRQLPPETIVFAPSRNIGDLNDADLKHATRYLSGRSCVLVFDDLNFYVGQTEVAELAQVIAEQASSYSIAATCTTSTLPQVRSEAEPALMRFFGALDQYEILRMTDEQMDLLAADHAERATERDPHDCGGNPGLLLLDFQRLREEYQKLSSQEMAVAEAIQTLFVAGISPITVDHARALASSGFGVEIDTPTVVGTLDRLRLMTFIRDSDPVLPEEAFFREVVPEDAVWARMGEVEEVLGELQDVNGLFQLGATHNSRADFERTSRVMRLAVQLSRAVTTSGSLVTTARALTNLGSAMVGMGGAPQEIEAAWRDAAAAGRESGTPEGLEATARALTNLGVAMRNWGRAPQEIEDAWRDAAAAGRASAIPEGLAAAAQAFFDLGVDMKDWERAPQEIEAAWRDAASAGRASATPRGMFETARALTYLGNTMGDWGRAQQEIEAAYREAATAGRASGTPEGLEAAAMALYNLGDAREGWERAPKQIEDAWRGAALAGRASATPRGLETTAVALFDLGVSREGWERAPKEIEDAYRAAATAGLESTTARGLVQTARALTNLGNAMRGWGRAPQDIEMAYRDAAAAGRASGTPEGMETTARALTNLGVAMKDWGRAPQEIEDAYREAEIAEHESGA